METLNDYINESWSLDQMQQVETELMSLFRFTARMGWGENDSPMDSRIVVFAGETDPQLIHNHLIATGWEYVETDDPESGEAGAKYKGYIRGKCDILVTRGNMIVNGSTMPGYYLGVYCDQNSYNVDDSGYVDREHATEDEPAESFETDPELVEIGEAMGISVNTRSYVSSHGKDPRGTGNWIIGFKKDIDFKTDKENEHYIQHNGPYKEAVKKAMLRAKELGQGTIYIGS